ncbi:unnamed protein product [Protopolystoma xenopodis]|uniref:Uncharacterized protein n=1 Tax=Protopolystoma xenopodis TaxID=117903 RepID=A0A3S5AF91_9PLAT|nr:unnamed protein product [Protopolystoma xenopodis]
MDSSTGQLLQAISSGDFEKTKIMFSSGEIDINTTDENGLTPLQQACFSGQTEIVEFLIKNGANVNSNKHKEGYTALMFAGIVGNLQIVEILLRNGARINDTNRLGRTASQMAAFVGNHQAVALINNFIEKDTILHYTRIHGLSKEPKISPVLANTLHALIISPNFTPVKRVSCQNV